MKTKILLVDDEKDIVEFLQYNLEQEDFEVITAYDGKDAIEKLSQKPDLIILDVMMPKIHGFDVCKKVREHGVKTPIILLTAKGEEVDKIVGLEIGADDYVTKPFSLRELLARIKALLRRAEKFDSSSSVIKIGRLDIHFESYNAFENGTQVQMSHKEYELLKFLWTHKNQNVSRDLLLKEVWLQEATTTRTIDNFIVRLRQKIEIDPNNPKIILTVHGIGYKLISFS